MQLATRLPVCRSRCSVGIGEDQDVSRSIPALVEPSVLRWARETVDLTPVAAARKINVADDRVEAWESGTVHPTVAQLRVAAKVYKRSLGVFFLPEPPEGFDTLRDFRRVDGAEAAPWSPGLHGDYRRAHLQREYLIELAEIEDIAHPVLWPLDPLPTSDEQIASAARDRLRSVMQLPLPRNGDKYQHLNAWIAALEAAGVLVMATSGGHVTTTEMRGFSLYFDQVPVIVVNGADAPRGRLFTLLHEYAHLLLHTEGLCDTISDTTAVTPNRQLEARCNAIAAAILMPAAEVVERLAALPAVTEDEWDYDTLANAAKPFGTSAESFLRRLVTLGRVDVAIYRHRRTEFMARYNEEENRTRPKGGNWYRNTVRDLGKGYVRAVADAHRRRAIDSYTAATYLNVKVHQIPRLAQTAALTEVI